MACTPHLLRQHKLFIAVGALGLFTLVCGIILGPMVNAEVDKKLKKVMTIYKQLRGHLWDKENAAHKTGDLLKEVQII